MTMSSRTMNRGLAAMLRHVSPQGHGRGNFLRAALWLTWLTFVMLTAQLSAAQAAGQARLLALRVSAAGTAHGGVPGAEVVLEVSRAVSFDAGVQASPLRLEVLVPGLRMAGKTRSSGHAALLGKASWRQVQGGILLSLPLRAPALIVDAHAERRQRGRPARLVVRLARTDAGTLARLLNVPVNMLQSAPAQAAPARARRTAARSRKDDAALERERQAYRKLIEEAASRPADIGDLIKALPLDFGAQEAARPARRRKGSATRQATAAEKPVIVVDAGHGGKDPGAVGPNGLKEKDIVLKFALALRDALEKRGYAVVLTRSGDTFLKLRQRVQVARMHHAAMFISIHVDKFKRRGVSGLGIYTLSEEASDKDAAALARMENAADLIGAPDEDIADEQVRDILVELTQQETNANSHLLAMQLARSLRGVVQLRRNPVRSAAFRVLRAPEIPSLLVELGYITNPRDVRNMLSRAWRRRAAARMAATIDKVLKERLALR